MPNWSKGTLKLRGNTRDLIQTLNMMFDDTADVTIDFNDGHGLTFIGG